MAKLWRLTAHKINAERAAGIKQPPAKVQARTRHNQPPVQGAGNWLMAGLLIRAGIQAPLPNTLRNALHEPSVPLTEGFAKRLARRVKGFFNQF